MDFNLSRVILLQEVRELHTLYVYIYTFCIVVFLRVFAHSYTPQGMVK